MKKLEASLAASHKRMSLLSDKRQQAKAALETAQAQRQKHLTEGDLDDASLGTKLQTKVDNAASVLAGLDDAIAALQAQIDASERELAAQRELEERTKASDEINAAINAIEARAGPAMSHLRELAQALSEIEHVTFEIGQLAQYIRGAAGEVELALSVALPDVRHVARAVKSGEMPIPRRPNTGPLPVAEASPPAGIHPVIEQARFTEIDRSAEQRTIRIDVARIM